MLIGKLNEKVFFVSKNCFLPGFFSFFSNDTKKNKLWGKALVPPLLAVGRTDERMEVASVQSHLIL